MKSERSRGFLVLLLSLVIVALAGVAGAIRSVEPTEQIAGGLFALVAIGAWFGLFPGLSMGVVATIVYAMLRRTALELGDSDAVNKITLARGIGYLGFGGLLGLVLPALRAAGKDEHPAEVAPSLKLAEPAAVERELARIRRGGGTSTAILLQATPAQVIDLTEAMRDSDLVVVTPGSHGRLVGSPRNEVTIVLPDTDQEGARVFLRRVFTADSSPSAAMQKEAEGPNSDDAVTFVALSDPVASDDVRRRVGLLK